jgi:uncharacterized protein YbjT (DUF2867 family)
VQGDVLDPASLETALSGVHTIFAMTTPSFGPDAVEVEFNSAKTIADVAVSQGASYIIFSILPAVRQISGGKYTKVTAFDAKAKAEQYIRTLPIKSAFYAGASFMENFQSQPFLAPRLAPDGTWVLSRSGPPNDRIPLVDAVADTGKFVGAILAEPEKYAGKIFCGAVELYSFEEIVAIMSKATGKRVVYKQISQEEFREGLLTVLPPAIADVFAEGFGYGEEFGYFGPGEEELVAWARENARGRLTTLEEYFEKNPLRLG